MFTDKTDSVAYYLEQFIPHHYATFGEETLVFYSNLFDAYIELGDMDKALDTYLQMKRIWNESLTKTTTGDVYKRQSPQWAIDQPHQESVADSFTDGDLLFLRTGSRNQDILKKKGDDVRIDLS